MRLAALVIGAAMMGSAAAATDISLPDRGKTWKEIAARGQAK